MADTKTSLKEANRRLYNINQRMAAISKRLGRSPLTEDPEYDSLDKARVELESHIRALQGKRNVERAEAVGRAIVGAPQTIADLIAPVAPVGDPNKEAMQAASRAPRSNPTAMPMGLGGTEGQAYSTAYAAAFAPPEATRSASAPAPGPSMASGAAPLPFSLQRSAGVAPAPPGVEPTPALGDIPIAPPAPTSPEAAPVDNTLEAIIGRLDAILNSAPPQLEEAEPLPPGAAFAAATMAALDPARYATSVAPELKRRDAERVLRFNALNAARQDEIQLLSQLMVAHERRLNTRFNQQLALERQDLREANQRAMQTALRLEITRANHITEQANAAVAALNTIPSKANTQRGEMLMARTRGIHEALRQVAANADANPTLVNAIRMELDQISRQASGYLNFADAKRATAAMRDKMTMLSAVRASMKRALAFIKEKGDVGGPIGGRIPWWLTPNYMEQDIERLRTMFGYITGPLNRALGGGAALTPFEGEILRGILLRVEDPYSKKLVGLEEGLAQVEGLLGSLTAETGGMVLPGESETQARIEDAPRSISSGYTLHGNETYWDPEAQQFFTMEYEP